MTRKGGWLQDFLTSIADLRPGFASLKSKQSLEELSRELLSGDDETSMHRIGSAILGTYETATKEEKFAFFRFLRDEMDIDTTRIASLAEAYGDERDVAGFKALTRACDPQRREWLRRLNQVPGATAALVSMRAELMQKMHEEPSLGIVDADFAHLFTSWFNRGFLEVRRVSWNSPASVLAKIIQYEAVHAIADWEDLQRRLQPNDRRCFAFFHPVMPDEPLVFVEVALCKGIPNSIETLLDIRDSELDEGAADTAAFYSISNCQKGLRGISFGNALIKQVVADLRRELPNLKNFVTLSPLPGFSDWLGSEAAGFDPQFVESLMRDARVFDASGDTSGLNDHEASLKAAASDYLVNAKRSDGRPLDPVARFHLMNGAAIHAVHAGADFSANGVRNAYGVMVNYHYDLAFVAARHEAFSQNARVEASRAVMNQAASAKTRKRSKTSIAS